METVAYTSGYQSLIGQICRMFCRGPCGYQLYRPFLHEVNSSPPSTAYMRQWIGSALLQIMALRLFGAKPLSEPMFYLNWILWNILQWHFNPKTNVFIHENASKNIVCEMAAILPRKSIVQGKALAWTRVCQLHLLVSNRLNDAWSSVIWY